MDIEQKKIDDSLEKLPSTLTPQDKVIIAAEATLAKKTLSLGAQRVFRSIVSLIQPDDPEGKTYVFKLKDFAKIFGHSTADKHTDIKEACEELRSTITLVLPDKSTLVTGLISSAHIFQSEVQIKLGEKLLPFYKNQSAQKYKLINIAGFKCRYTFKIYEMLHLELSQGNNRVYKDVQEFKEWLECETKYVGYGDFKRSVIIPVLSDINGEPYIDKTKKKASKAPRIRTSSNYCNIHVEMEEEKQGRKVVGIWFNINQIEHDDPKFMELTINDFYDNLDPFTQDYYNILRQTYGVQHSTIRNAIEKYGETEFQNLFREIHRTVIAQGLKIKNKTTFAASCLNKGICENYSVPEITDAEIVESVVTLPADREQSIRSLRGCNITDANTILELLKFSDEHIEANVKYCIDNYRIAKGQQDIAAITITAIQKDYAHYQLKADEEKARLEEIERAKQEEAKVAVMDMDELQEVAVGEGTLAVLAKERLAKIAAEKEVQLREDDYIEMKAYFFQLSPKEQEECKKLILSLANEFESKFMKNKSFDELWASVPYRSKVVLGTKEYKKKQYEKIQTKLF